MIETEGQDRENAMGIGALVADSQRLVREAICSLLRNEFNMDVVGQAEDGRAAIELAGELRPDVVLIEAPCPI